jgi:hypothetical protein
MSLQDEFLAKFDLNKNKIVNEESPQEKPNKKAKPKITKRRIPPNTVKDNLLDEFFSKQSILKEHEIVTNSAVIQQIKHDALVWMDNNHPTADGLPDNQISSNRYKIPTIVWNEINENLRQRKGELRPKDTIEKFLNFKSDHRRVKLCIVPHFNEDGSLAFFMLFKGDGMTRTRAWRGDFSERIKAEFPQPAYVYADVEFCWDLKDAHDLYIIQDNQRSVKKAHDDLSGAVGILGFNLVSPFHKEFKWKSALELIHLKIYGQSGKLETTWVDYQAILWAGEIYVLDGFDIPVSARAFLRPPVWASLVGALRVYQNSPEIRDFVYRFVHKKGTMLPDGTQDAVSAAHHTITNLSKEKKIQTANFEDVVGCMLNAIDKHMKGEFVSTSQRLRTLGKGRINKFYKDVHESNPLNLKELMDG